MKRIIQVLTVISFVALVVSSAQAKRSYLNPINDACGTNYGCGLCHIDTKGGGPLTADGDAYVASGYNPYYFCPGPVDGDGDGYDASADCNDNDASINPGAVENCTDGVDNDCDDLIDAADPSAVDCPAECTDADGDNYNVDGGSCGSADCDDSDFTINPGAVENCTDGVDNDCDNNTDCADSDCIGTTDCPVGSCADYNDKTICNNDTNCEWRKKGGGACVDVGGTEPPTDTCGDYNGDETTCKANGCRWNKKKLTCN